MKKLSSKLFLSVFLLSILFALSSCGDKNDDFGDYWDPSTYRVDVEFIGDINNYFKQVSQLGSNTKGMPVNPIDVKTGKEVSSFSMSDSNYAFSTSNSFTFSDKLNILTLTVGMGAPKDDAKDLKVKVTVYRDGKVEKVIEETATKEKDVIISQSFGKK